MKYDVEFIKVNDLHPYEKNAKKHPQEQIDYIKNSIKQFGFRQNLVVDFVYFGKPQAYLW